MAEAGDPKKPETVSVKADQVKIDEAGYVTISDPKVAEVLQRKAGVKRGEALRGDEVSVGVVVSKSF